MNGTQEWVFIDEFCKRTHITRRTLYNLWSRGEGPKRRRLGRRIIIMNQDAMDWSANLPEAKDLTRTAA